MRSAVSEKESIKNYFQRHFVVRDAPDSKK